jgi:hypothetical protein
MNNNEDNRSAEEHDENAISAVVICIHSRTGKYHMYSVRVMPIVRDFPLSHGEGSQDTFFIHNKEQFSIMLCI